MSSIALPMEKQIRHFFPFTAVAAETTPATFIASASNGELQILDAGDSDGSFYILKKDYRGTVVKSDLIKPKNITYLKGSAPVAKVGKRQVFTVTSVVVGAVYNLSLKVHYANSEKNFMYIMASQKAVTGDTPTTLLTKLAKQLGNNLANSIHTSTNIAGTDTVIVGTTVKKNKYFTLSQVAGALTITEKDWILDGYVPGLKTFDQLMWNAELESKSDAAVAVFAKTATVPVYAKGQGYQMIELERYLVGHRGAEFGEPDVTTAFRREYECATDETYYCLDLKYFDVSRNDPYQSDKMLTLVSADPIALDTIGFAIESRMAEEDNWTELDPAQDGSDNA